MSNTPTTSPIELLAAFDAGFAGIQPIGEGRLPLAERLELFRERIIARHKNGYSWNQIAEVLKQPKIGLKVSPVTLRRQFSEKPKNTKRKSKRITSIRVLPPLETSPAPTA